MQICPLTAPASFGKVNSDPLPDAALSRFVSWRSFVQISVAC